METFYIKEGETFIPERGLDPYLLTLKIDSAGPGIIDMVAGYKFGLNEWYVIYIDRPLTEQVGPYQIVRAIKLPMNQYFDCVMNGPPDDWQRYHHPNCGTAFRDCDPVNCAKDVYEKTGIWDRDLAYNFLFTDQEETRIKFNH